LKAAGKVPWPGLDPGMFLQTLDMRTEGTGTAGADGSSFWYLLNQAVTPTTTAQGKLVSGSGQTIVLSGPLNNLWYYKSVAGDLFMVEGKY